MVSLRMFVTSVHSVFPAPCHAQIIFVLDCTSSLCHSDNFFDFCLQRIISPVWNSPSSSSVASSSKSAMPNGHVDFSCVLFGDYPPFGEFLVRHSSFTRSIENLSNWISAVVFLLLFLCSSCSLPLTPSFCFFSFSFPSSLLFGLSFLFLLHSMFVALEEDPMGVLSWKVF